MKRCPANSGPPRRADPHANAKWPIYAATVISWLGFLVHNVADLPGQTFLGPETFWAESDRHRRTPPPPSHSVGPRRVAAIGLFIWAALNFLGAGDRTAPGSTALRYRADAAPLLLPRCRTSPRRSNADAVRSIRPRTVSTGSMTAMVQSRRPGAPADADSGAIRPPPSSRLERAGQAA